MTLSIRVRLTLWYSILVALTVVLLGTGVFLGAKWGLRSAADLELTSGIDGVATFLRHKLAIHQMDNLGEELREHSALLPRGKMFRVSLPDGSVVYQPDPMTVVTSASPKANQMLRKNMQVGHRSFRSISRFESVGPWTFLIQVAVDQTEYSEMMTRLAWWLVLSIPVAGLLAALGGYWMSGRALSPIHRITEAANSIDAQNLILRLPLMGTNDELDRLSKTINRMLDRIAASYERIAQFTADASHELRTPVALIRSNAELLLMGPVDDRRMNQGVRDILAESEYMARLIGDLLTLARAGAENAALRMELFELGDAIDAVLPRAKALAATKNIHLDYVQADRVVPIHGSRASLERLLMILIDNAVRYTHLHGQISLTSWASEELCGFTVNDSGIGIAYADHQRIFERFFRVNTARTPRDGGWGLGLAIALSLAEAHRGRIVVESEPGRGSSFRVEFPRADVSVPVVES